MNGRDGESEASKKKSATKVAALGAQRKKQSRIQYSQSPSGRGKAGLKIKIKTPKTGAVGTMRSAQSSSTRIRHAERDKRFARILRALLRREHSREQIDRIAGASNGPDEIMRIKRTLGFKIRCKRRPAVDRDGRKCRPGWYSLLEESRPAVVRWLEHGNDGDTASQKHDKAPKVPSPSVATAKRAGGGSALRAHG